MNTRDRLHQVFRYLLDIYPCKYTGRKPRLRVMRKMPKEFTECSGGCTWHDDMDSPIIYVQWARKEYAIATLIHEYCHCLTQGRGIDGGHGDEFYLCLGELERDFNSHGYFDSRSY